MCRNGEILSQCNRLISKPLAPIDAVTKVTDFYARSNVLIGGKRRVAGVTLQATDTDWSHGSGPVVSGPARAPMLATKGRRSAPDELTSPGVEALRSR